MAALPLILSRFSRQVGTERHSGSLMVNLWILCAHLSRVEQSASAHPGCVFVHPFKTGALCLGQVDTIFTIFKSKCWFTINNRWATSLRADRVVTCRPIRVSPWHILTSIPGWQHGTKKTHVRNTGAGFALDSGDVTFLVWPYCVFLVFKWFNVRFNRNVNLMDFFSFVFIDRCPDWFSNGGLEGTRCVCILVKRPDCWLVVFSRPVGPYSTSWVWLLALGCRWLMVFHLPVVPNSMLITWA